jgi:chromosomal replication initiator protein
MVDVEVREGIIQSVQGAVAHLFSLSVEVLRGRSTQRAVAVPRHIAIYLNGQLTDATQGEIGQHFGGRHHSTVMNSIATIEKQRLHQRRSRPRCVQALKEFGPSVEGFTLTPF